jgi:Mce-associated membrane protein
VRRVTGATTSGEKDGQTLRYQYLVVVLAVLLVAAVVVAGLLLKAKGDAEDRADAAEEETAAVEAAHEAARDLLVDMTSYDYQDLDEVYDWIDRLTNADLKAKMTANEEDFKKVVTIARATAEGEVVDSAYRANEDGSVTVIAYIRQEIRDAEHEGFKTDEKWATLVLVEDGGTWLVDDVDLSNVPSAG